MKKGPAAMKAGGAMIPAATTPVGTVSQVPGAASGNAPAGVAGSQAASGNPGAGGAAGAAAAPTSGTADAGANQPANDAGSGAQPDCTPSAWKDRGTVPNPTVVAVAADAGTTGHMFARSKGISDYDYLEEEFFFTGTSPAYTTRMVVHRPKDPAKFTGTVMMEWYNVTGGIDIAPLWALDREYMMREGHVHVGVSAQQVGANALKDYDAVRYAAINHPGDQAANAIFGQAAMAIRSQGEKLLGPCMPVHTVLAMGQSQSSSMLGVYLSDAHPKDEIYDGFLLHTDPSGSLPTSNPDVPVFTVFTMTEGTRSVPSLPNLAEWEVAGATHNDAYLMARGAEEQGADSTGSPMIECVDPVNNYPSFWVYNAAIDWLNRWVRKGDQPPVGAPLQTATDQYGNVMGGVRIQDIDVPIATYTAGNTAKGATDFISILACGLSGAVVPLTAQQLMQAYPTHDDYVQKYTAAADKALAAGYLLPADHAAAIQKAQSAPIPK
ncbi:MAG: alpha/beta hydrolase domain-containing protein [Polyangiales bacterium]